MGSNVALWTHGVAEVWVRLSSSCRVTNREHHTHLLRLILSQTYAGKGSLVQSATQSSRDRNTTTERNIVWQTYIETTELNSDSSGTRPSYAALKINGWSSFLFRFSSLFLDLFDFDVSLLDPGGKPKPHGRNVQSRCPISRGPRDYCGPRDGAGVV